MKTRFASALSRALSAVLIAALLLVQMPPSHASQGGCILPTTGTVSGLTMTNDTNACFGVLLSLNSGATAPAALTTYMLWLNTISSYAQQYDGSSWNNLWYVDATNHLVSFDIGGGITSRTIAVAATMDVGSVQQPFVTTTGGGAVTSLGTSAKVGSVHVVVWGGINTLTYNATSLIIPGTTSVTTATGDTMIALYLGSGNWRVLSYIPISGAAVSSIAGATGAFTVNEGVKVASNVIKADPLYLKGYLSGLTLSWSSATAIGIAAGAAVDDAQTGFALLASAFTKTTSAWAAGTANGGLDTGTIGAAAWYHVYLMKRPDTGVVDVCYSLLTTGCVTGGSIPAAYTVFRRIGSVKTASSQFVSFTQVGDEFTWSVQVNESSTTAGTTSRNTVTLTVPTGFVMMAKFRASQFGPGGAVNYVFTSLLEADIPASTSADMACPASGSCGTDVARLTNILAQIGVRATSPVAPGVYTYAWTDTRGK